MRDKIDCVYERPILYFFVLFYTILRFFSISLLGLTILKLSQSVWMMFSYDVLQINHFNKY